MIAFVFALRRESSGLRQRLPHSPLVLDSGIGARCVQATAEKLRQFPSFSDVRWLIAAGFSGGLRPDLNVGKVVLADAVLDPQGERIPTTPVPGLPELARGPLVTTPKLITTAQEKRRLAECTGAVQVDMESFHWARFCQEQQIAFTAIRAISDDVHTEVSPRLLQVLAGEHVRLSRLLAVVLRQPSILGELWRIHRATRQAADALTEVLVQVGALLSDS